MGKIIAFVGMDDASKRIVVRALTKQPYFQIIGYVTTAQHIPNAVPGEYQFILQNQFDQYAGEKKFLLSERTGSGWSGGNRRAFTKFAITSALEKAETNLILPTADELTCIRDYLEKLGRLTSLLAFLVHSPSVKSRESDCLDWYDFIEVGLPTHLLEYEGDVASAVATVQEKVRSHMFA